MLKSALNYFSSDVTYSRENDFVGQTVELGQLTLKIRKLIAEGGFAFVFVAQDSRGNQYALKRLIAVDRDSADAIVREISFLKKLSGHPNILEFVQAANVEAERGRIEYLLLTEFCSGGSVVELLQNAYDSLPVVQILRIFYQTCSAVKHLHVQDPPVIHRDLKIENLLIDANGMIKLCDFGSATTQTFVPDPNWSMKQRSMAEDELTRHTTPMYRPPEMLDLYQNLPVDYRMDIWALGCILYYLCYKVHPFEDSAKLRILNANYSLPENDSKYGMMHDLIYGMLQIDPVKRPSVSQVLERLEEMASAWSVQLKGPVVVVDAGKQRHKEITPKTEQPPPPAANTSATDALPQQQDAGGTVLGSLRGQAGSLFKNLKDTSAKVMQQVQAYTVTKEFDISYVTTRVIVTSWEGELADNQTLDNLRQYLDMKHKDHYAVYNLSNKTYPHVRFQNRVSDCGWHQYRVCTLHCLFSIWHNMHLWLRQDPSNICVLHCLDGVGNSALVACGFTIYTRLFQNVDDAIRLFIEQRTKPFLFPSMQRYLNYTVQLCIPKPSLVIPHNRLLRLNKLTLKGIPLFNRMKTGCRPFVEVYVADNRLFSNSQEYDKMRQYEIHDNEIEIALNQMVSGDVTLMMFHARSTFGDRVQGKLTSIKMFQIQFHSSMIEPSVRSLLFKRNDLDVFDEQQGRFPANILIELAVTYADEDRPWHENNAPSFVNHKPKSLSSRVIVSTKEERDSIYRRFGIAASDSTPVSPESIPKSEPKPEPLLSRAPLHQDGTPPVIRKLPDNDDFSVQEADLLNLNLSEPQQQQQSVTNSHSSAAVGDLLFDPFNEQPGTAVPPPNSIGFDPFAQFTSLNNDPSVQVPSAAATTANVTTTVTKQKSHGGHTRKPSQDDWFGLIGTTSSSGSQQPPARATTPVGNVSVNLLQDWNQTIPLVSGQRQAPPINQFQAPPSSSLAAPSLKRNPKSTPNFGQFPPFGGNSMSSTGTGFTAPVQQQPMMDPFAGLGVASASVKSQQQARSMTPTPSSSGGMFGDLGANYQRMNSANATNAGNSSPLRTNQPPLGQQPNARSNPWVNPNAQAPPTTNFNAKPKSDGLDDQFDDLLQQQGFTSNRSHGPSTLAGMRRDVDIQELTPIQIKIRDWTEGKQRNIRALLGSLHTVLWEDNTKWDPVNVSQLLTAAHVKKYYRKACLAIHPDKYTGTEHEELARAMFTELNDAWNEFENAGEPSL